MTRVERVAASLLKPINPSVIIILGIYTIMWGVWVANPIWTVFTQAPVYSAMAELAGEVTWGSIAVVAGLFIVRGATKPSYDNLVAGSIVGFFYWLVVGALFVVGDWQSTGGINALVFAAYSGIVWLNIKRNRDYFENERE